MQNQLFSIFQDLNYHGQKITAQLIKSRYMGEDETCHSLQELIAYHTEKIEKTLAAGTIRNFGITENYINRFLTKKRKTSDIYLKELNYKFICDFEIFLFRYYPKGHPKAMSHNTVMKHIQRLRKMVTIAYHLEWVEKDPFLRWKPTFEKGSGSFCPLMNCLTWRPMNFPSNGSTGYGIFFFSVAIPEFPISMSWN